MDVKKPQVRKFNYNDITLDGQMKATDRYLDVAVKPENIVISDKKMNKDYS